MHRLIDEEIGVEGLMIEARVWDLHSILAEQTPVVRNNIGVTACSISIVVGVFWVEGPRKTSCEIHLFN